MMVDCVVDVLASVFTSMNAGGERCRMPAMANTGGM